MKFYFRLFIVGSFLCLGGNLALAESMSVSDFNDIWDNISLEPVCYSGNDVVTCNCADGNAIRGCVRYARQNTGSFSNPGDVEIRKLVWPTEVPGIFDVNILLRGKRVSQVRNDLNVCSVVVFDVSGSMGKKNTSGSTTTYEPGEKWYSAVSGAKEFSQIVVDGNPNAKVGLVTFGTKASVKKHLGRDVFDDSLFVLNPVGENTNVHAGLIYARDEFPETGCDAKYIVLMSDGVPTNYMSGDTSVLSGSSSNNYKGAREVTLSYAEELKSEGIIIYSIGYEVASSSVAAQTLKSIATDSGHYFLASSSNVSEIFQDIGNVTVEINAGTTSDIEDEIGSGMMRMGDIDITSGVQITDPGTVYSFKIKVKPDVSGFQPSNSGLTLVYDDVDGNSQVLGIDVDHTAQIYWTTPKCEGTYPGGASVVVGRDEFTQTWEGNTLTPETKEWTYTGNSVPGECEWTCTGTNYRGDVNTNTCVLDVTVTFDPNGGDPSVIPPVVIESGENLIGGQIPSPTKTGYNLTGWTLTCNGNDFFTIPGVVTGDITLCAKWVPNTYEVKFNGNGSSNGSMNNQSFTYDVTGNLNNNQYGKIGYHFTGWNTKNNGSGVPYKNEAQVKNLATGGIFNLYAQWEPNKYTVVFSGNGSTNGTMGNQGFTYDETGTLNNNAFAKEGYRFVGWNTKPDRSGTGFANKDQVLNLATTGKITLYAQWAVNTYEIKFNGNGSTSGSMTNQELDYDSMQPLKANVFEKKGYHFTGWNTNAGGTGTGYLDRAEVKGLVTGGIFNLYAQREPNNYTIIFDGNGASKGTMAGLEMTYDQEKKLSRNDYSRNGYKFLGWNTSPDGKGTNYTDEQVVKNLAAAGEVTLYAQWQQLGSSGGGGNKKDDCPDGDYSGDRYDGKCGNPPAPDPEEEPEPTPTPKPVNPVKKCSIEGSKHSAEVNEAYVWACQKGIIKSNTIQGARLGEFLNRAEMAKIVTVFEMLELDAKPNRNKDCSAFADSISGYNNEMKNYIVTSCQLERMGIHTADYTPISDFMPKKFVSRAEFGTILSRILWGDKYEAEKNSRYYYVDHLNRLKNNGILTNIDPTLVERRSYAILMIYRAAKMMGKI